MLCHDDGFSLEDIRKVNIAMEKEHKQEKEYKERLDLVTRLLCGVMTGLDEIGEHKTWHPFNWTEPKSKLITGLQRWWAEHKEMDQERIRKEFAEKLAKKTKLINEIKQKQKELEALG